VVEKKDILFVVRVNINKIRAEKYYKRRVFPEYITAIDFQNQNYMAFVINDFIESRLMYSVVFEDRVFRLQRDGNNRNKTTWEKEGGIYTFTLCTTAQEAWDALKGFIYQLVDARKTLLRQITKGGEGEWVVYDEEKHK
jgi:hypothetical protein